MELKILKVGNDGEGIAFYNKKPVYVYYAYKNEVVDVDKNTNKRGVYEGELNRVITPSPHRVKPKCPYYGKVGAANLMHINYEEQLVYKKEFIHYHINTKFKNQAKFISIHRTIPSKHTFNYRNKIDMPVQFINGNNKMGLFIRGTNKLISVDSYVLHEKALDEAANKALELMDKYNINAYNSKTREGYVTHLSVRNNEINEVQLTFILKRKIDLTELVNELMDENKNIVSVYYSFVPKLSTNRDLFTNKLEKIAGLDHLTMNLGGFKFLLAPNTFFQLNTEQAKNMFDMIIKLGKLKKTDVVLDAYSGVGPIATFISPHVKEVYAIERVSNAIRSLEASNLLNNITNIRPIVGDVIHTVNNLNVKFDVMVFDPPRTGLNKLMVSFILNQKPKKVIYVSCNPETLARDLKELSVSYKINSVTPLDMFPQTSHTESITILNLI